MLDEGKNNYLGCICALGDSAGLCFADVSTGAFYVTDFTGKDISSGIINELGKFTPKEVLINQAVLSMEDVCGYIKNKLDRAVCELLDDERFDIKDTSAVLCDHFGVSSAGEIIPGGSDAVISAAGAALDYLRSVQKSELRNIVNIDYYGEKMIVELIIIAIIIMIIFGILKWMMRISFKIFGIGVVLFIILLLLGYIF